MIPAMNTQASSGVGFSCQPLVVLLMRPIRCIVIVPCQHLSIRRRDIRIRQTGQSRELYVTITEADPSCAIAELQDIVVVAWIIDDFMIGHLQERYNMKTASWREFGTNPPNKNLM